MPPKRVRSEEYKAKQREYKRRKTAEKAAKRKEDIESGIHTTRINAVVKARRKVFSDAIAPTWKEMCDNIECIRHAIVEFKCEEDIVKQNEVFSNEGIKLWHGCKCKEKKTKQTHTHRHLLLQLTKEQNDADKNKRLRQYFPTLKFISSKYKKITCQLHLKNALHYVHCTRSMDVKDLENGGWKKGRHEHYEFINAEPQLLHKPTCCMTIHRYMWHLLKPSHNQSTCPCPRGNFHIFKKKWIKRTPRQIVIGSREHVQQMKNLHLMVKLLKSLCWNTRQYYNEMKEESLNNLNDNMKEHLKNCEKIQSETIILDNFNSDSDSSENNEDSD